MVTTSESILRAALALPSAERASIAEKLFQSLDEETLTLSPEWEEEVEGRLVAFERGEMAAIPGEEVMRSLSIRRKT